MQVQIKAKFVSESDGLVTLVLPLDENREALSIIRETAQALITAGVPARTAYGLADDMTDGITRDAVAGLINPNQR